MNLRNRQSLIFLTLTLFVPCAAVAPAETLRVGTFEVDASPNVGAPLAYDPCVEVTDPLTCRGVVLVGSGKPIVIAAFDWIGVANEAHRQARQRIAAAAGTTADRVAVHALHQHDAPRCDFTSAQLLAHYGVGHQHFDVPWAREVFARVADAAGDAVRTAEPVDSLGLGAAEVEKVASNRRILGPDGKVAATRYTACRDPELRAEPAGTIDPQLRSISFWKGDQAVAVMTYYATHPQSYYRTGKANPDFPGYARNSRQQETGVPHIHLNGAGGNIGAGKWNDGSPENRPVLAGRVAGAMRRAFEATERTPIDSSDVAWETVAAQLPLGKHIREKALTSVLADEDAGPSEKLTAAKHLAWLRRTKAGETIDLQCLTLAAARVLHMPGELFVEYQLAAQEMRPELFVAMAAYGEYGPGYIGTKTAYTQGGYETSERASRVSPAAEAVLRDAMAQLLDDE